MLPGGDSAWRIETRLDTADRLHMKWPPPELMHSRVVAFSNVSHAAVVLGSTQRLKIAGHIESAGISWNELADGSCREIEVISRSSGGGAVYVAPAEQLWVDFWLPKDDMWFDSDILRSSVWVGNIWAKALNSIGVQDIRIHEGRLIPGEWGSLVCFASTGPGEVFYGTRKVVGISQRRTRDGIWFQTMAPLRWEPGKWIPCMLPYLELLIAEEHGSRKRLDTVALDAWLMEHVVLLGELGGFKYPDDGTAVHAIAGELVANLPA